MKLPIDLPSGWRKTVGIAVVAIVAVVIVEGTGIGAPAVQFVSVATNKVKTFFSGLFNKPTQ
jgi:hypothetical protein